MDSVKRALVDQISTAITHSEPMHLTIATSQGSRAVDLTALTMDLAGFNYKVIDVANGDINPRYMMGLELAEKPTTVFILKNLDKASDAERAKIRAAMVDKEPIVMELGGKHVPVDVSNASYVVTTDLAEGQITSEFVKVSKEVELLAENQSMTRYQKHLRIHKLLDDKFKDEELKRILTKGRLVGSSYSGVTHRLSDEYLTQATKKIVVAAPPTLDTFVKEIELGLKREVLSKESNDFNRRLSLL